MWTKYCPFRKNAVCVKIANELRYSQNLPGGLRIPLCHYAWFLMNFKKYLVRPGTSESKWFNLSGVDKSLVMIQWWNVLVFCQYLRGFIRDTKINSSLSADLWLNVLRGMLVFWSKIRVIKTHFLTINQRRDYACMLRYAWWLGYAHADVLGYLSSRMIMK